MKKISKIDNKSIYIEQDGIGNNHPASYEATQGGSVVVLRHKTTGEEILRGNYAEFTVDIDGSGNLQTFANAGDLQRALNTFIGNFSAGGDTPPTPEGAVKSVDGRKPDEEGNVLSNAWIQVIE